MSVQAALQFIQAVRQDENLKDRIRMLGHPASGEELVQVGRDAGFEYNEAELQAAYKHDWVMRSLRYGLMLPSQNQQETHTNLNRVGRGIFPSNSASKTEDSQCLEKVRSYYDKMSPIVLKNVGTTYQAGLLVTDSEDNPYRATNLYCATQAGIQPGDRVLDAGCGVCGPSIDIALSIEGVKIDGITISPVQADTARTLVQQAGLADKIQVWVGDYHKLPFAKETFDVVMFLECVGYSYNIHSLFAEVDRVLRPGGILYIKDIFRKESPLSEQEQQELAEFNRIYAYDTLSVSETIAAIAAVGFQAVESTNLNSFISTEAFVKTMFENQQLSTVTEFGKYHYRQFQCLPCYFAQIKARKPKL